MIDATHRCANCGSELSFVITRSTIDTAITVGCHVCGCEMDRLDALGAIEAAARGDSPPHNLRDELENGGLA